MKKSTIVKDTLEQDIENLKRIEQGIQPYSKWWRWGFLSSVRRAIRIMEILKRDGMIYRGHRVLEGRRTEVQDQAFRLRIPVGSEKRR